MKLFGTDGVRGIPGRGPLTQDAVRRLAAASVDALLLKRVGNDMPVVLIGRDTRSSGPSLLKALSQGFAQAKVQTVDLGILPTPAVAHAAARRATLMGVVVSASHNPAEYNGIKFFDARGFKLSEPLERRIESRLPAQDSSPERRLRPPARDAGAAKDYSDYLRSTFPATQDLSGLKIVLDCANGAASALGPELLRGLGAEVVAIGCRPNGRNINAGCGATDLEALSREVRRRRADCGIALDGDADRALFVDEKGKVLSGDLLIALSALHLKAQGILTGDCVVATVMSNIGFVRFLNRHGISVREVGVGDRNVTDRLEAEGLVLGGENSGHIIFRRFAPTGDGLLTALQTLAAWRARGGKMSLTRSLYRDYPQILKNVRIEKRLAIDTMPEFGRALSKARKVLGAAGRLFVRYSGTEPLLRILAEGPDRNRLVRMTDDLARVFKDEAAKLTQQGV